MSRMSAFNSPLLLGFDHFERVLDRISKTSAEGYPPYNIEQTSENGLRITLAVAGFSMDDLSVALEDNQLVIRGRQNEDEAGRVFIHRGIAARHSNEFQHRPASGEAFDLGPDPSMEHRTLGPEVTALAPLLAGGVFAPGNV